MHGWTHTQKHTFDFNAGEEPRDDAKIWKSQHFSPGDDSRVTHSRGRRRKKKQLWPFTFFNMQHESSVQDRRGVGRGWGWRRTGCFSFPGCVQRLTDTLRILRRPVLQKITFERRRELHADRLGPAKPFVYPQCCSTSCQGRRCVVVEEGTELCFFNYELFSWLVPPFPWFSWFVGQEVLSTYETHQVCCHLETSAITSLHYYYSITYITSSYVECLEMVGLF